jgi:type I restriction enzyme, S subunit
MNPVPKVQERTERYEPRAPYAGSREKHVEWMGRTPEHWKQTILQRSAKEILNRNANGVESNVLSLSYGRIIKRDVTKNEGLLPESFDTYQIVEPGDIVLRLTDLQNDQRSLRVGLVGERGIITSAYMGLRPSSGLLPKYLYYFLYSADTCKVFYGMGAGVRQTLDFKELRKLNVLVPPPDEQESIVRFLDPRVARVDLLIRKKQRLIDLLQEKRTALISLAVTKGLDRSARLRDLGVGWLPECPAHWKVEKARYVGKLTGGATPSREVLDYWDGPIPWVTPKDMKRSLIDGSEETVTDRALKETRLPLIPADAVLFVVRGMILVHSFPVALTTVPVTVNQDMKALRVAKGIVPEFVCYFFSGMGSVIVSTLVDTAAHGTKALRMDSWLSFKFGLPPEHEQLEIVRVLNQRTRQIDGLIARAREGIRRLTEYRIALVFAAVTGKCDVQGVRS